MGARVELPGLGVIGMLSIYMQVSSGLNETNVKLLASAAIWQDHYQIPILMAGDLNMNPKHIQYHDYVQRAGMLVTTPTTTTFRTKTPQSCVDYFAHNSCLEHVIYTHHVHEYYPLSPHRPVSIRITADKNFTVPVLCKPQRLPTKPVFRPKWP